MMIGGDIISALVAVQMGGGTALPDSSVTFSANGTYNSPDGVRWNPVIVNVPSDYTKGFADGVAYANGTMGDVTVESDDGTYTFSGGAVAGVDLGTAGELFQAMGESEDTGVTNTSSGWMLYCDFDNRPEDESWTTSVQLYNVITGRDVQLNGTGYSGPSDTILEYTSYVSNLSSSGFDWTYTTRYKNGTSYSKTIWVKPDSSIRWAWNQFVSDSTDYTAGAQPTYTAAE
ncbi:MAG: hypothetical protein IJ416_05905 [Ruminiclostridium sp.]|nr:hypothetical protein [Ruminiclostridium sp.]